MDKTQDSDVTARTEAPPLSDIVRVKIQVPDEYRAGMKVRFSHPCKPGITVETSLPENSTPGSIISVALRVLP